MNPGRALTVSRLFLALVVLAAGPAGAEGWLCRGEAPAWQLRLQGGTAEFVFPATTQMQVELETTAEARDWPRAYTLIGARDTAILLVDADACAGAEAARQAHVLTQRGQTPILLTCCCEALP